MYLSLSLTPALLLLTRIWKTVSTERERDVCVAREILSTLQHCFVKKSDVTTLTAPTHKFVVPRTDSCTHSHNCHHHRWKEDTLPPMHTIKLLFEAVYRVVSKEPVLLEVSPSPVYIIGDIHGNYHVCFLGISLFTFLLTQNLLHHNTGPAPILGHLWASPLWRVCACQVSLPWWFASMLTLKHTHTCTHDE